MNSPSKPEGARDGPQRQRVQAVAMVLLLMVAVAGVVAYVIA